MVRNWLVSKDKYKFKKGGNMTKIEIRPTVIGTSGTKYEDKRVIINDELVGAVGEPVAFYPRTDSKLHEQPKNAISPKPENG